MKTARHSAAPAPPDIKTPFHFLSFFSLKEEDPAERRGFPFRVLCKALQPPQQQICPASSSKGSVSQQSHAAGSGMSCGSMSVSSSAVSCRWTHSTRRRARLDSVRLLLGDKPQDTT